MSEIDIAGVFIVGVPLLIFFWMIWWIWREEERRAQLRAQRTEEWKREIARFHESAREISSLASRKIVLIDLGGKTAEEQEAFIELVREELKRDE